MTKGRRLFDRRLFSVIASACESASRTMRVELGGEWDINMGEARLALAAVVALSAMTGLADVLVKKATVADNVGSPYLFLAALIFGGSAYGWFFVLKYINLATLGAIYSIITVLLLVMAGTLFFGEELDFSEIFVIIVSFIALAMFWRHL